MRSSKARSQRGGNDQGPSVPAAPEVAVPDQLASDPSSALPKAFFTSPGTPPTGTDNFLMSGGKRKVAKKVAKKPAVAAKKKAPAKAKKGGSLADELKSLAVPFAILLAKQGLDGMFDSKKKGAKKAIEVSSSKRKTAVGGKTGGACSACTAPVVAKAGGAKGAPKSRYAQLTREIDDFLAKY